MEQVQQTSPDQPTVAVLGYGTAGVNAVIGLRTAGYDGPIRVFTDSSIPPYSPILTSYYAGGEKTYEECFPWSEDELSDLRIELHPGAAVEQLDVDAHTIRTSAGEFAYSKCVIATGAKPMTYGFPDVEGFSPIVLRTMDDAERLKGAIEDPKCERVLVSGASMVALKTLEACLNHGVKVTLVGMNPHVLDFNALPEAAARFEKGLLANGVELRLSQTIKEVETVEGDGPHGFKLQVTFSNGDVDVFDDISVNHGMKSNLDFVVPGTFEGERALVVDEFMRTSDPDVYAAGEVAQGLELVSGEKRVVGIWKAAARQGACAGTAIAIELAGGTLGPEHAYEGSIPMNTIAVKDTLFISAGTMEVTDGRHVESRETDDMLVLYIFQDEDDGTQRLVGFNLTCDHDEAGSVAYDTGAMLTLRIEAGCRR